MSEKSNYSKLLEGVKAFQKNYYEPNKALFQTLAKGQSPETAVIACTDSRLDPLLLTSSKPGDLFVIRAVANLVPSFAAVEKSGDGIGAALYFAVEELKVKDLIILGHSDCGGIQRLMSMEGEEEDFVGKWMAQAMEAKEKALEKSGKMDEPLQFIAEKELLKLSYQNLLSFPFIKARVDEKRLSLHAWHFEVGCGELLEL